MEDDIVGFNGSKGEGGFTCVCSLTSRLENVNHRRRKAVSYEGPGGRVEKRRRREQRESNGSRRADASRLQWNIVVSRQKGWPTMKKEERNKNGKIEGKRNLRVRQRNPGRRDHVAAGPFPVRRHLLADGNIN